MDSLTAAFYDVMYQYRLPFSPEGVAANLTAWRENKTPLVELLRRHPNWNEQELAIVFDFSESREIDHNSVDENKFEMMMLANDVGLGDSELSDFQAALDAVTADYATVPDAGRLDTIRTRGHIKCAEGQKASRIINRLCCKFGLDQYQVERIQGEHGDNPTTVMVKPYNAIFARLADSLNPVQIPKTGILSVHPCDFLEMSSQKNSWQSCHRLNGGGYRAGCQSYMCDGVSMIFFTVDDDIKADFYHAPRLTRQIFCYKDGLLLQSRLYPHNEDNVRKLYRSLVQGAVARCLGIPNLWSVKSKQEETRALLETEKHSLHYPDYEYSYGVVSLLNGTAPEQKIVIGSRSLCTCCGQPHDYSNSLKCGSCKAVVVYKECGRVVPTDEAHYMEEAFFCRDCVMRCEMCGSWIRGAEIHQAISRSGRIVRLCEHCHTSATGTCGLCSSREICQIINAGRFCPHVEYAVAAVA